MTYLIEEFKVWPGIDSNVETWSGINLTPSTREGAEEILEMLSKNRPDRKFRIKTFVTQHRLDRYRHDLAGALRQVKAAESYARHVAEEIAELKREAYRQGVELR